VQGRTEKDGQAVAQAEAGGQAEAAGPADPSRAQGDANNEPIQTEQQSEGECSGEHNEIAS
jgi:hypothetical protein